MRPNSSGVKAEWPFLIAISYPDYINRMASCLHSTDNFSAMEAQVHLKLAKHSKKTCSYSKLPKCANLRFLLATLTHTLPIAVHTANTYLRTSHT